MDRIEFPLRGLDIVMGVQEDLRGKGGMTYDCMSVVHHIGITMSAGHYIKISRRHNVDDWIKHIDTRMSIASVEDVRLCCLGHKNYSFLYIYMLLSCRAGMRI